METDWADRDEKRIWIFQIVLVIIRCWLFGLPVPFQLDERAPVWVIAGGWGDLLRRSTDFTQSTLHCAILLVSQKAFGLHEPARPCGIEPASCEYERRD